jgi:3-methyladenine DNA glycosylase AlkD
MKSREAQALGQRISTLLQCDQTAQAYALLTPALAQRTPFVTLRRIGAEIEHESLGNLDAFLKRIASDRTEGGWVVISGLLAAYINRNLPGALSRCHAFIIEADIWYAADTFGEWVVGQALVDNIQTTLDLIAPWREDKNPWVRRAVGTSVHYWAKRSRGTDVLSQQAEALLSFIEPLFEEQEMKAIKGIGWGLKTLGKHYSDLTARWLEKQVVQRQRPYRALMLRKALTYLSEEQRAKATGNAIS